MLDPWLKLKTWTYTKKIETLFVYIWMFINVHLFMYKYILYINIFLPSNGITYYGNYGINYFI